MATVSDTDLKELKELILGLDGRLDRLDQKVESLDQKVESLGQNVGELDKKAEVQAAKLEAINQRLDDLRDQFNKQDNRFWGLFLALFITLIGIVGKVLLFPSNLIG
jgi:chromosome segregation ATPase